MCVLKKREVSIRSKLGLSAEFPCGMDSIEEGGDGAAGMLAQAL